MHAPPGNKTRKAESWGGGGAHSRTQGEGKRQLENGLSRWRQHSKGWECFSQQSGSLTYPCHTALSTPQHCLEPIVVRGQEGCGPIPAQATCDDQAGEHCSS